MEEIYDLLNRRTLKFKEENIKFISKKMGLDKFESEKIYKDWKNYYMNTTIDENLYFRRRVRNVETDETFNTPKQAGEKVGCRRVNISSACCNGKSAGGYHWEYI